MPRARDFASIFDTSDTGIDPLLEARERLENIAGRIENRIVPFMPWNERIPVPGLGSLDFSVFPFQREWYDDEIVYRRFVCWMKATQVGVSEYAVRWALFFPDTRGETGLYVFPAKRQLRDFSDQRVKQLVKGPYLRTRVPRGFVDNKELKQVGLGWLYFRGSKNATDLDSVPAGILALDEYDDLVAENIPRAEKRLSSPLSRGLIRRLGVPRYSDMGIHEQYERSDKREWLVRCRSCKVKELPIHFYAQEGRTHHFVDVERGQIVCANCEAQIRPEWIAEGRWVAEHPGREHIGYHVHRLVVPSARIADIIAESDKGKPFEVQEFWNSTLGLPYDPAEGRLSKEAIKAATRNYFIGPWDGGYNGENLVTMGVDVASVRDLNVRISEHLDRHTKRALFIGPVSNFDQLATMIDAFNVNFACIDHGPDGRLGMAMVNRFPGRCWLVSWGDRQKDVLAIDEQMGRVSARRTETISTTLELVRTQKNQLPENLPRDYVKHMRAAVLKRTEDEKGRVVMFYETRQDHDYLQAESYDVLAHESWWALYLRDHAGREEYTPLDAMMEFQRTRVNQYDEQSYSPGPPEEETWGQEVEELERGLLPDDFTEFG